VAALQPEIGHQYEVPDPGCPGLYLRVMPSGKKTWAFRWSTAGRVQRITLGGWPATTLEQARSRAGALRSQWDAGQDPAAAQKARTAKGTTLVDLAERFRAEHLPRLKPKTVECYEHVLDRWILPQLGARLVQEIDRATVAGWHSSMGDTARMANHALAVLSKMLSLAVRWGIREGNPCVGQERYRETKRQRYLDTKELAAVLAALGRLERAGNIGALPAAAIRILLLTGARKSEILGLQWAEVDLKAGVARLADHKTVMKVGERSIVLPPEAVALLKKLVHNGPRVFWSGSVDHAWRKIREAAGCPDVRLHDLRHTYASMGVASGLTLAQVGQLLGHSTPATTQRYAHLVLDAAKKNAAQVAAQMRKGRKKG
jgi:integrase